MNFCLLHHNYEIAEYLNLNLGQTFDSIAESMYFGNYEIASYLLSKGDDINKIYNLFLSIFIIILKNSLSFHIYHDFKKFSFFLYLSLFYYILFLFKSIIVLLHSLTFDIYHLFYDIFFLLIFIIVLWNSLYINEFPLSIAIYANSIEIVQFLVEHGANVNMKLILFLFIFIFDLLHYLSFHIYHWFITLSIFSYLSLIYYILFLFIFIIVLWHSLSFHI